MKRNETRNQTGRSLGEGSEGIRSLNIQSSAEKEVGEESRRGTAERNTAFTRRRYGKLTLPRRPRGSGRAITARSPAADLPHESVPAAARRISDGGDGDGDGDGGGGSGGGGSASPGGARSSAGLESTSGRGLHERANGASGADDALGSSLHSNSSSRSTSSSSVGAIDGGEGAEPWATEAAANEQEATPQAPACLVGVGRGLEQRCRWAETHALQLGGVSAGIRL